MFVSSVFGHKSDVVATNYIGDPLQNVWGTTWYYGDKVFAREVELVGNLQPLVPTD